MSLRPSAGEPELDGRSDIYALGAMLYEMLAGQVPFAGPTAQAIIAKLFTDPPPPLRDRRHDLPDWLEAAVARALAKSPAERFASANQFAQALKPSGASTPPGATPSAAGVHAAVKSTAVRPLPALSPHG